MSHGCSPTIRRRRCNQQSGIQRRLPDPKKSRLVKSKEKAMLIAFFDIDGVVHHEFVPPGQTVLRASFAEVAPCGSEETMRQVGGRVVSVS